MRPTQRKYTEFWSNETFTMFQDDCTHKICLISDKTGETIENFYCSAFTDTYFRFWDKSQILLKTGQFIKREKTNPATHKKFFMQKRFSKF